MTEENNQSQPTPTNNEDGGVGAKTIVSWLIVLVIIAGGAFLLLNDTKDDNTVEGDEDETSMEVPAPGHEDVDEMIVVDGENTVTYTDDGFLPKEITIKKGEGVMFINESSGGMWVGSAMHPTHEVYPIKSDDDCLGSSFDQCVASNPGTSWKFQFDAEGEHGYHNHVRANHFGKVIVE